jgi:hypothetical protein
MGIGSPCDPGLRRSKAKPRVPYGRPYPYSTKPTPRKGGDLNT